MDPDWPVWRTNAYFQAFSSATRNDSGRVDGPEWKGKMVERKGSLTCGNCLWALAKGSRGNTTI